MDKLNKQLGMPQTAMTYLSVCGIIIGTCLTILGT